MNNIDILNNAVKGLFDIACNIGDDVGIWVKKPNSADISQYRIVYGDRIYTGHVWLGITDEVYINGHLFEGEE